MRRRKGREFKLSQIQQVLQCPKPTIHNYVKPLADNVYLAKRDLRPTRVSGWDDWYAYRLIRDTGKAAPMVRPDGTIYDPNLAGYEEFIQQRIWNALRLSSYPLESVEIAVRASSPDSTVKGYLQQLERYRYLRVEKSSRLGRRGGGRKSYSLVRNTGPLCPVWKRGPLLFDQNLEIYVEPEDD